MAPAKQAASSPLIDRRAQSQGGSMFGADSDFALAALVAGVAKSKRVPTLCGKERKGFMSEERDDQERPCLHCIIVELIDDFFAEYPATTGESATIDTDEVITAIAKTVAELTCSQDGTIRQQLIERLMREIMNYDAEFRQDDRTGAIGSAARH
jgi:hypothetical protein